MKERGEAAFGDDAQLRVVACAVTSDEVRVVQVAEQRNFPAA